MDHKKKYFGGSKLLLLLLFGIFFVTSSTCYATVTSDYVQFILDSAYNDTNFTNNNKSWLATYKNDITKVESLTNNINVYGSLYNVSYSNFNLVGFSYNETSSSYKIIFVLSNCGAGSSSTGFLSMTRNSTYVYKLGSINGSCVAISLNFNGGNTSLSTITNLSNVYVSNSGYTTDSDDFVLHLTNCYNYAGTQSIYFTPVLKYCLVDNGNFTYKNTLIPDVPDEPSGDLITGGTGTISNNSGETTGKIDLSGIQQGIGNIQNQISGDTQKVIEDQNQNTQTIVNALSGETEKITNTLTDSADDSIDNTIITSGDIESALNFEIAEDPYSNFWFTLTNNLKSALLGSKRSIDISFQGRTWTISLDQYMVLPAWLVIILTPFSTAFFTWVLVRQWKHIFDKLASGNIDSILKENSEERYF